MTWHTTSFFVFSLVRNSNWPADTGEPSRITAPLPKTRTVFVVSENGSRLSLPSIVRAPLTVTGTSRATGCGLLPVAVSSWRGPAATGTAPAVSRVAVRTSFSLLLGAIWVLTSCVKFLFGYCLDRAIPELLHVLLRPCSAAIVRAYQQGNTCPEGQSCCGWKLL